MESMATVIIRDINMALSIRDQANMETMVTVIIRDLDLIAIEMIIAGMGEAMANIGSIMIMINSPYRVFINLLSGK